VTIEETGSAAQPASNPALVVINACKKWRRDKDLIKLV
jgi:hypothetical protein